MSAAADKPYLRARPRKVPFGLELGKATISWSTGDETIGDVYVSREGGPETLAASAPSGSLRAEWLENGRTYSFRLYRQGERLAPLASVEVVRERASPEDIVVMLSEATSYEEAAKGEQRWWGSVFSDPQWARRAEEDVVAAADLRIGRGMLDLPTLLREGGYKLERCLSLGCGAGRLERSLLSAGIGRRFDGIDIAADALETAEGEAKSLGLNIRYSAADLNFVQLEVGAYDLVLAQTCLHHVLHLEHLIEQIWLALRPKGLLWVHDYIGETQLQYGELRMAIANAILARLPDELLRDEINQRFVRRIEREPPGAVGSPFEAIRSAEIMPLLLERFSILHAREFDSILQLVCPAGTRAAFARTEGTRELFENLFELDRLLIRTGVLTPTGGQFLLLKN